MCRDAHNNAIKIQEHAEIKKIATILRKNRRALKKLFNPKKSEKTFNREELIKEGFEFGFLTHIAVTQIKGNEIIFCYDYGYRELSAGVYQLYPSFGKITVKGGGIFRTV